MGLFPNGTDLLYGLTLSPRTQYVRSTPGFLEKKGTHRQRVVRLLVAVLWVVVERISRRLQRYTKAKEALEG